MLSELPRAILEIGLPVAVLSWLLFYRLYSRGELARFETRIGSRAVELDSRERWLSMVPFRKDGASAVKAGTVTQAASPTPASESENNRDPQDPH